MMEMKNMRNETIDRSLLREELLLFSDEHKGYEYDERVYYTALMLHYENEALHRETDDYLFIPQALIPLAFVISERLSGTIKKAFDPEYDDYDVEVWWSTDEDDFIEYWGLQKYYEGR